MTSKHPEPSSWPSDGKRPSPAARARTAVAAATIARLTTYSRRAPVRSVVTGVDVEGEDRGRPVVLVPAGSLAAVQLLARPLASLQIAPPGHEPTTVHGGVRRLPGTDEGRLRYRVEVGAVRVGHGEPVPVESYLAAEPDPLRDQAPGVLAHLSAHHGEDLQACLRALGHDPAWVEPRALDRLGLDLLAVGPAGVDLVRLAFPEPVERLQDLAAGVAAPLLCRCGHGARRPRA